jgi:formamidopyrimidine-DNA glycosylase
MPELPEVETIRADLEGRLVGRAFTRVEVSWPRTVAVPDLDTFLSELPGHIVERAGRRGKYLVFDLDRGAALTVHLRMTGRLRWVAGDTPPSQHARAVLYLDGDDALHFEDQRKFGRLYFTRDEAELADVLRKLGPEPLEAAFTRQAFRQTIRGKRAQLKPLLLDQRFVAGLGNIYVDEALFRAKLHPLRRSDTLTDADIDRLHEGVVAALQHGIINRGTTLADYRDAWGTAGRNKERLLVFRREGKPCGVCGTPIEKIRVGQRGTHLCPSCQKAP